MTNINSVILVGRLVKDADVKTYDNGGSIYNFTIAVNRSVKVNEEWKDEASFFDCKYSVKSSKLQLKKGMQVAVSGYLKQDRWEKDGKTNSKIVVVVTNLQFFDGAAKSNQENVPPSAQALANAFDGEVQSDIPF